MYELKEQLREGYDEAAKLFADRNKDYIDRYIRKEFDLFLSMLPPLALVLDLGAGTGIYAKEIEKHGHKVICADISQKMLEYCKEKGLETILMDYEHPCFPNDYFDGLLAYTSLHHTAKKEFPGVFRDVTDMLKAGGPMLLGMKEGDFEGLVDKYGAKFFESWYQDAELQQMIAPMFDILMSTKTPLNPATYLNYVLKKKIRE